MTINKSVAYFNGDFIKVDDAVMPLEERGLQFGDSVYEVIRVYNGKPYTLIEHLQRLLISSESIMLASPNVMELEELVLQGIDKLQMQSGTIYLQITRGSASRNHEFPIDAHQNLMAIWKVDEGVISTPDQGVKLKSFPDERWKKCFIKSTCLLPNVLAKEKAKRKGCYEALLIRDAEIKECSAMNVFIVKDGVVKTPPADQSILNGITRQKVLSLASQNGLLTSETVLTIEDIEVADEIFITSTTKELIPVTQVDNFIIGNGKLGENFSLIHRLYKEDVIRECGAGTNKV
ncbi:amino acid aminotransferase [Aquibacillus halophilus]|uniref:Amino acid aminotransferase n=1 Tax=Aquibacillus halophilus TaxID=930132 RepID=A0A6A8DBQ0_9BACI|nr:aminotransferase class IV [Aquibacillus halophilus]MRH41191.1 amino acid aminotransferase [Aquibacillus halophilus]